MTQISITTAKLCVNQVIFFCRLCSPGLHVGRRSYKITQRITTSDSGSSRCFLTEVLILGAVQDKLRVTGNREIILRVSLCLYRYWPWRLYCTSSFPSSSIDLGDICNSGFTYVYTTSNLSSCDVLDERTSLQILCEFVLRYSV